MNGRVPRLFAAGLVGSLLLAATACGSDGNSSKTAEAATGSTAAATTTAGTVAPEVVETTAAPAAAEAVTVPAAATEAGTNPPAPPAGGKVKINDASTSELEAAFDAAGVTNARRWAREVDEYRPYPSDPDYAKLRQELGKYNIDPAVLELIISTLEF